MTERQTTWVEPTAEAFREMDFTSPTDRGGPLRPAVQAAQPDAPPVEPATEPKPGAPPAEPETEPDAPPAKPETEPAPEIEPFAPGDPAHEPAPEGPDPDEEVPTCSE